jgi:hypothetical protein
MVSSLRYLRTPPLHNLFHGLQRQDTSVGFKFNHTYVARADATMTEPPTGRAVSTYAGLGKAVGPVSRGSKEDDEGPISKSVQAALNDVFSKLETDTRLTLL